MSTWVVEELGTADFTDSFEKMAIDYIFTKWAISDPAKGGTQMDDTASLRFKINEPDYKKPFEVTAKKVRTDAMNVDGADRTYDMKTYVDITLRAKRLQRDNTTQLENMEKEVQRIAAQYRAVPQDITGIKNIIYTGDERLNINDNWATSTWRSVVHIYFWYYKRDLT